MGKWADRIRAAAQRHPELLDAGLATALLVAAVIGLSGDVGDTQTRHADALAYLIAVAGIVPYYFRRRAPLAVLLIAVGPTLVQVERGYTPGALGAGIFILVYTVAAWCDRRRTLIAAATIAALIVVILLTRPAHLPPADLVTNLVLFAGAFLLGRWAQDRRAHLGWIQERAALLERDRERDAAQAAADERVRIAQELHDVMAHSIGVIAVQAGVGGHVIDTHPAEAKQALAAISQTSRETLTEIRHILGTLRRDSDRDQGPARGLTDLGQLATEMTEIGVPVSVRVNGQRNGLPVGVDLAGYRVVQEALTNVLKHAGRTHADVAVRYEPSALTIEITNDGADGSAQTAPHVPGSGRGLTGMRERVAAWGGTLQAGPRAGGGFRVWAHLPYGPA